MLRLRGTPLRRPDVSFLRTATIGEPCALCCSAIRGRLSPSPAPASASNQGIRPYSRMSRGASGVKIDVDKLKSSLQSLGASDYKKKGPWPRPRSRKGGGHMDNFGPSFDMLGDTPDPTLGGSGMGYPEAWVEENNSEGAADPRANFESAFGSESSDSLFNEAAAEAAETIETAEPRTTEKGPKPPKPSGRPRPIPQPSKPAKSGKGAPEKSKSAKSEPTSKQPASKKKKANKDPLEVRTISAQRLKFTALPQGQLPVPSLSYGLDRCLFTQGVYPLQDPRSRVYNFDPYLTTIMPTHEFDFTALRAFVSSSEDVALQELAARHKKKYSGSTSSMSSMLAHFHYLLSAWRPVNASHTSRSFTPESTSFTRILRAPAATFLRLNTNGTYAIDADKQFDTGNVLSMLGKSMEKLLTLPKEEYELYRRSKSDQLTEEQKNGDEAFHYTTMGDFILRSQLDAYDPRVPRTGMFDIKTRAVLTIRMDAARPGKGNDYEIRQRFGQFESFEREYFDMVRSAFLKYSLQVRMGRMDGIFVAYHNTRRIFGFQYIPIEEMDHALHGTSSAELGDQEFRLSMHLLNDLLNRAVAKFPGRSLRLHVEARPTNPPLLYFFAKPVSEERIKHAQGLRWKEAEKFEKQMMGLAAENEKASTDTEVDPEEEDSPGSSESESDSPEYSEGLSLSVWTEMNQMVEEAVQSDELGVGYIRRNIEEALEQSGLLEGRTAEETRLYVDTLLETLTGGESAAAAQESWDGSDEQQTGENGVQEGEQDAAASEAEASESTTADSAAADSSAESPQSEEAVEISETSEAAANPRQTTIKDLIMRLAEQVDDRPTLSPEEESALEEQLEKPTKLQKFERLLSQLMAESGDDQDSGKEGTKVAAEETTASSSSSSSPEAAEAAFGSGGASDDKYFDVEDPHEELLGMILTVRNKVNGKYVTRPEFTGKDAAKEAARARWSVEYSVQTMAVDRAETLYAQLKKRRAKALAQEDEDKDRQWHEMFDKQLPRLNVAGRKFRRSEDEKAKGKPVFVVDSKTPLEWNEVFGTDNK